MKNLKLKVILTPPYETSNYGINTKVLSWGEDLGEGFARRVKINESITLSPSPSPEERVASAFTLAEVLITLVIIGVIAAITVPTLINNHNKMVFATQLKKDYSILTQGFRKMLVDEGVQSLNDTSLASSIPGSYCIYTVHDDGCNAFYNGLKKYFNIMQIKDIDNAAYAATFRSGITKIYDAIYLSDGSIVLLQFDKQPSVSSTSCDTIKSLGGKLCKRTANIWIDVNGAKGPNKQGRDLFWFMLSTDANMYPYSGRDASLFFKGDDSLYWKNGSSASSSAQYSCKYDDDKMGWGCAARIMENNWVMDY